MRIFLIGFILFTGSLFADNHHPTSHTFAWDPKKGTPYLGGYRLFFGKESGKYDFNIDVGNVTTYTVNNILEPNVVYYVAVKAYNTFDLESDFSNEINFVTDHTGQPSSPKNLRKNN